MPSAAVSLFPHASEDVHVEPAPRPQLGSGIGFFRGIEPPNPRRFAGKVGRVPDEPWRNSGG